MKIQVGIFFGGPSRERERSFLSGRTIYDNLDRALFDPIPIFVDGDGRFILLRWEYLCRSSIRDFYPPLAALPPSPHAFRVYADSLPETRREGLAGEIGRVVPPSDLPQLISLAFLAIPGTFGGDGALQQVLTDLGIPFTGCGAQTCRRLADRAGQKRLLAEAGLADGRLLTIDLNEWRSGDPAGFFQRTAASLGFPVLVRPTHQAPPIGLSIVDEEAELEVFTESIDSAFFRETIPLNQWGHRSEYDKIDHLRLLTDPRDGLGFPIDVTIGDERATVSHPEQLLEHLNRRSAVMTDPEAVAVLSSHHAGDRVLVEPVLRGQAFSCLVLRREGGGLVALTPTERLYGEELFDYRDEDDDGLPDDPEPLDLGGDGIRAVREACVRAFDVMGGQAYARVDGFVTPEGRVSIDEIHPVPAMPPAAFFFQQMASIGLTPAQAINYILRVSVQERIREQPGAAAFRSLLAILDDLIAEHRAGTFQRRKIAVLFGGGALEAPLSLESGRNVYQKLLGSEAFDPLPVFVIAGDDGYQLFQLPVSLVLMNDAAELAQRLAQWAPPDSEEEVREECRAITLKYGSRDLTFEPHPLTLTDLREWADVVFIALQGRPADGRLQDDLEAVSLPFTGPGGAAARLSGDRCRVLDVLRQNGLSVPAQLRLSRAEFETDPEKFLERAEQQMRYPLFAKPIDERSPAAVRRINNRTELLAYVRLLFRPPGHEGLESRYVLRLRPREPFPRRDAVMLQEPVSAAGARHFVEISGALITRHDEEGAAAYVVFPPCEVLANREVLTLEEQYRSGGSRYLLPARLAATPDSEAPVQRQVQQTLERAARILNLQGSARLDAFVRVFDGPMVETIVYDIHPMPAMIPQACLLLQATRNDLTPLKVFTGLIEFALGNKPQPTPAPPADEPAWVRAAPTTPEHPAATRPTSQPMRYGSTLPPYNDGPVNLLSGLRRIGREAWAFLRSPYFLRNLGVLLGMLLVLFLALNLALNLYTHHGESLQVQDYRGMNLDEARRKARGRSFKVVVSDSVFLVDRAPNIVLEQDPQPFSRVKENRRIYLTITSTTAPRVLLPDLEGAYKYETYSRKLIRLGLKPTIRERQFDSKLEENTVLYFYHDGERITEADLRRGVKVPKGSVLEFVVTERLTDMVPAPSLVCKRFEEAAFLITATGLVIGEVVGDVPNRDNAYVYLQEPDAGAMIRKGEQVSVYLSETRPGDCPTAPAPELPVDTSRVEEQ